MQGEDAKEPTEEDTMQTGKEALLSLLSEDNKFLHISKSFSFYIWYFFLILQMFILENSVL